MLNFFKRKKETIDGHDLYHNEKAGTVSIVRNEEVTDEQVQAHLEVFSGASKFEVFKGKIDNAYESDFTGYTDHCPACSAPTKQMYSGFVYATQTLTRIMTAPAGHFCTKCPTFIIDDDMIRSNMAPGVKYGGTCSLNDGVSDPKLFATLNGKKVVYVLGEDGTNIEGIIGSKNLIKHEGSHYVNPYTGAPIYDPQIQQKNNVQKSKNRSKNKAAKKSRSSNRKK